MLSFTTFSQVQAEFTYNDSIVCEGECIEFTSTTTGASDQAVYQWTFTGSSTTSHTGEFPPEICFPLPGSYTVTLDVSDGTSFSSYSETIEVGVYPDSVFAFGDTTIEMAGAAFVYAEGYPGGGSFMWEPSDIYDTPFNFSTFVSPLLTQYAMVTYFSPSMCGIRDSVLITVTFEDVVDLPNSFSPNGDGLNEIFFVKGPGIETMTLKVFDRYGGLVFESNRQDIGWDGTKNGALLNPATFLWTLEYSLVDGTSNKKSGTITLIK